MTTVLKVDVDYKAPKEWLEAWERTRKFLLEEYCKLTVLRVTKHETTKGQNYFIEIDKELTPEQTNYLQFLLGDDHTRVKINAWRIQRGVLHWNKIFDRKLWRKGVKTIIECFYCGNMIPLISHEPLEDGKEVNATSEKDKVYKRIREEEKERIEKEEKAAAEAEAKKAEELKDESEETPEEAAQPIGEETDTAVPEEETPEDEEKAPEAEKEKEPE